LDFGFEGLKNPMAVATELPMDLFI